MVMNILNFSAQVRCAPKILHFRDDASYLIVGGLRGLCGALAIYLAKSGAKHLAVISRSGHTDEKSRSIVKQIKALGSSIDLLTADVTSKGDVQRVFNQTTFPVRGIIQGAMVLRVSSFFWGVGGGFAGTIAEQRHLTI